MNNFNLSVYFEPTKIYTCSLKVTAKCIAYFDTQNTAIISKIMPLPIQVVWPAFQSNSSRSTIYKMDYNACWRKKDADGTPYHTIMRVTKYGH